MNMALEPRERENGILDEWRKNKMSKNDRWRERGSLGPGDKTKEKT